LNVNDLIGLGREWA